LDAQAAIVRMASDDPGPGKQYALEARRHITALRAKKPNIYIEIRWCPSHQGIEGNETADEWDKLAADEPDAHGVEWLSTTDPDGKSHKERFPPPAITGQCQERVLRVEVGRLHELDQGKTSQD